MQRHMMPPRPNWQQRLESHGFAFHSLNNTTYWNEDKAYELSEREVYALELASKNVFKLCLDAVERVIHQNRFAELRIPEPFAALCRQSWDADDPTLYGRFDFALSRSAPPKLLEFNADTPTALLEAAVAQWVWLEDQIAAGVLPGNADQFNSLHEKLIEQFGYFRAKRGVQTLHFASVQQSDEDFGTTEYLRDLAMQVGIQTKHLGMQELGWDHANRKFVDLENAPISHLFKLYPWEDLIKEPFGAHLLERSVTLIEPAWKMILSNKGILPILWEMSPGHPNLLPASFTPLSGDHVKKPIFSREGANIAIQAANLQLSSGGEYGAEGYIHQAYAPLPEFGGNHAVVGAWIIGDMPAGIGIREDDSAITTNTSRFVPHYFLPQ
jgi:glutathionylspermidine synthase